MLVKVKNVADSIVIVPGENRKDLFLSPGDVGVIDEKYLTVFSGKLIKVPEETEEKIEMKEEIKEEKRRR